MSVMKSSILIVWEPKNAEDCLADAGNARQAGAVTTGNVYQSGVSIEIHKKSGGRSPHYRVQAQRAWGESNQT